jgi:hypothetical protein
MWVFSFQHKPSLQSIDSFNMLAPIGAIMFPIGAEVGFLLPARGRWDRDSARHDQPQRNTSRWTDLAFGLAIALVEPGVHMIGGYYAGRLLLRLAIGGIAGGHI